MERDRGRRKMMRLCFSCCLHCTSWVLVYPKSVGIHWASFPLFDALGELHDGQTAEGTLNFTSSEPSQHPILTQVDNVDEPSERESTFLDIEERVDDDDDDDEISISTQQPEKAAGKDPMEVQGTVGKRVEKEPKKCKQADVAGMMQSYIAMKTKQAEEEAAARERAKADVD